MGRIDPGAYAASQVDWRRLKAFARRVADSTPVAPELGLALRVTESVTREETVKSGGFLGIGATARTVSRTEDRTIDKSVLGPHWVLDTKISEEDAWYGDMLRTDHQVYYMVLEVGGALTTVLHIDRRRQTPHRSDVDRNDADVREFSHGDVTHFDFEKVRAHWTPKTTGRWPGEAMNDSTGTRLQRHAKGVGLSMRLKELQAGPLGPRPFYNKHLR